MNCTWITVFIELVVLKRTRTAKTQETLDLTKDERIVLEELAKGKLQKQIGQFSQNTVTKLLKSAQERNHCKSKQELISRYLKAYPQTPESESQNAAIESQDKSQAITG